MQKKRNSLIRHIRNLGIVASIEISAKAIRITYLLYCDKNTQFNKRNQHNIRLSRIIIYVLFLF